MASKFSYSAIKDFENCGRKYHEVRILKKFRSQDTTATLYGTAVHLAFENFVRHGTPLPPEYAHFQHYVEPLTKLKGELRCEEPLAIRADFSPCEYAADDAWMRGIPDFIAINPDAGIARVVDYKTGASSRFADTDQLQLMAAMIMVHNPTIHTVKGMLLFVVAKDIITTKFVRDDLPIILSGWAGRANAVEAALANGVWNPRSSGLCGFCPVESCPHFRIRR